METTKLGNSPLTVSRLCIGCMGFGLPSPDFLQWTLNPQETEEIVRYALSLGINFFDTANCYSHGTSEEYLGRAIRKNVPRHEVILASKVYFNEGKLSREAILREIDGSLRRLGTDYLDLYILHRFDYSTPMEETLSTLHELVRAGKVRALGASAMYASQFEELQKCAMENNWTPFVSMQNHYNLLYREDEQALIPLCDRLHVARTSYSPLASGRLCRTEWHSDSPRSQTDQMAARKYDATEESDRSIVARVAELARQRGVSMTAVSLAWQFSKGVAAPVIGATKRRHLDDAVAALSVRLTREELQALEENYRPHKISGARAPDGT